MGKRLYREYDEKGKLIKLQCGTCREIKTIDNFNKNKNYKDGYKYTCKLCLKEYRCQHYQKYKEKILEYHHHLYQENKEKINERNRQLYQDNKEKILKHQRQYHKNKSQIEISKIYENVTKNLYPNNGIQYGIIYGVHCINNDRWYIGQTIRSFNLRYDNNFFKRKFNELLGDNEKAHLLHEDIEKYGQENFEIFEVIVVAFSEKELDEKEVYYIGYYKEYDEGYNSNRGNIFKHEKSKRKDVI